MPILGRGTTSDAGTTVPVAEQVSAVRSEVSYGADTFRSSTRGRAVKPEAGPRSCGAAGCSSGWIAPWKNRKRPVFEGDWACSGKCLKAMVRAAVRRERGEISAATMDVPQRHRVPLGLVLLAQGWITHPQLQAALEAQKSSGEGRIGEWLVQSCGLAEERVTRGLGVQWSCPVLTLNGFSPEAMALVMPKRFVAEFGLVPLRVAASSMLYMAFEDRANAAAALGVEQMTGLKVESGLLSASQFEAAKRGVLDADAVPMTLDVVEDADEACTRLTKMLEAKQPLASRLVRVHQYYWMRMWLESGALSGVGRLPTGTGDVQDYLVSLRDTRVKPK